MVHVGTADLLHAFKVLRIRFLLNDINIVPDKEEFISRKDVIINLFKDGKELTDLTPIGKMRDIYAIAFFSLENLANLIIADEYYSVAVILPFVCFVNAVTNSAISINTAVVLLEIAFEGLIKFLNLMSIPQEDWEKTAQKKRANIDYLTVLPMTLLKRLIPTIVTLLLNMKMYVRINIEHDVEGIPEEIVKQFEEMIDFAIDRLTTHPEENFNGFIRDEAKAQDTVATIMRIVARSSMVKNFLLKHGIDVTKRGRANVGGLKASEYYGVVEDLVDVDPKQLVDAIFVTAGITHERACISPDCNIEVLFKFVEWVDKALPFSKTGRYQRIKQNRISAAAGSKINARNIFNNT